MTIGAADGKGAVPLGHGPSLGRKRPQGGRAKVAPRCCAAITWVSPVPSSGGLSLRTPVPCAPDQDGGADGCTLVQVQNILVQHADATAGDLLANGPGLVRPMNAEKDVPA